MSYATQGLIAADEHMRTRVAQSAAQEGVPSDPDTWTRDRARYWASAPGWDLAWESAVVAGITEPGAREDVITDGMILAVVQPMVAGQP